jgi:hypothetical protein
VDVLTHAEEAFGETDEYRRLLRMVEDQSKPGGCGARVLKEGKEISPTSMQSPYDEDATYRKKTGKSNTGYTLNVIESCGDGANVIADYDLQPNVYSDEQFAEDVLNSKHENDETETIAVDGAYSSTKTLNLAEEKGIDLSAASMSGGVKDDFETGFKFDEDTGEILECPAGHIPNDSIYKW